MTDAIQQQLISARKHQILDAAAHVFASKGFHAATIKDVAREAGIADGTIYNYFANKTALLFAIFERMRDSIQPAAAFADLRPDDVRGVVRAFVSFPLMALRGDNFELFRVVMSELMVNDDLRKQYAQQVLQPTLAVAETLFQQWAAQGLIKTAHLQLTVRALSSMVMGLILQHIMGDDLLQGQWEALPDVLTDLIMQGIGKD
ncbi:MAG: TetR/AcrR family transcriptional regulator [Chloroflexota bacterium]|nr:TetR/AcrR family transcriptional regulator [Chloroflexota bacterium]